MIGMAFNKQVLYSNFLYNLVGQWKDNIHIGSISDENTIHEIA